MSSGRPIGAERRGRSGAGHSRQSRDFLHVHNSRRPLGWRASRTPGTYGAERGVCGVEHAAGALCRAGIAIPWPTIGCQNRDFGPRQLCIRPPPGGWRQGQGAPVCMRGREGRIRCGTGRPAGRARGGGALQGRDCHPVRQPQAVRTGILVRGSSAFARPPGVGGKGGAHPTICRAERGVYSVERAGVLKASAAGALCAGSWRGNRHKMAGG